MERNRTIRDGVFHRPEWSPGELQSREFASYDRLSHVAIISKSNAVGTFHVHNNYGDPRPSKLDINIAKTTRKMVYVGSRDGLYCVDPDGNVRRPFSTVNWFDKISGNRLLIAGNEPIQRTETPSLVIICRDPR